MSVYLDASILVSSFTLDPFSLRAEAFLNKADQVVLVSDFAAAEFASVVARKLRTGDLSLDEANLVMANFDAWTSRVGQRVDTTAGDVATATTFIRRLDLPLRTPDAIHIAIAQRAVAKLATFDLRMAASAQVLGVTVEPS